MAAEDVVHVAELGRVDVEDRDVGAHAHRYLAGIGSGDAGAEDHDLRGPYAGGAGEEHAAAAVLRLQAPGAHLHREPPGDLAHGGEERQRAVRGLQRLVGEGTHAAREEHPRELRVGREVQVREQDLVGTQEVVLGGERLLHLEDQLRPSPHRGRVGQRRAGVAVEAVGQARAVARAVLHHHRVSVRHQRADAARRERDAVLLLFDLARDADDHARGV